MASPNQPRQADLSTPVQYLKGCGPQRAEALHRLGLHTARDVLFFFPRDYDDLTEVRPLADLEEGATVSVRGQVTEVDGRKTAAGGFMYGVLVRNGAAEMRAIWYHETSLVATLRVGQQILLTGRPRLNGLVWEMAHPQVKLLDNDEQPPGELAPIYPLTEGVNQHQMRRVVRNVVETRSHLLDEVFPEVFLSAHDLWPLRRALPLIHFPDSAASLAGARRRFVYQELFILQLALGLRRQGLQAIEAPPLEATAKIDARIQRLFPFEMTSGQQAAIAEIARDMARPIPMNRLLQGDVGSGKTAVAVYAMLQTVAHGYQAALMAPTEVLARQHLDTFSRMLAGSQVRMELLVGGLAQRKRNDTLARLAAGEIDLIIGTHALAQDDVQFAKPGLVIIDEQHKFGVRQRAASQTRRPPAALPGDDRDADPAHAHDVAVRRFGRLGAAR